MKIIHTADWHLGNRMHDIDRTQEVQFFLDWLKEEIVKEGSEALVISGDIFDTINPPTEARTQFKNFLSGLLGTSCTNIFITGGNHDSAAMLDADKEILSYLNINIVGSISNLKCEDMVFEIKDKKGNVQGVLCAVPFAREAELRQYFDEKAEDGCFSDLAWGALYSKVTEEAEKVRAGRDIPLIATGHLYAADLEGRENCVNDAEGKADDGVRNTDITGKLGRVHAGVFGDKFDYVALGHIHYTTMVAKNPRIRYSGSPFVMGFDEVSIPRVVLSVDVQKEKTEVKKTQVPSCCEYRRIAGNFTQICDKLEEYKNRIDQSPVYLEICYTREEGMNIQDRLDELLTELEHKKVYAVSWRFVEENQMKKLVNSSYDMEEVKNIESEKIFKELILSKAGVSEGLLENETAEEYEKRILDKYLGIFVDAYGAFCAGEGVNENC